MALAPLFRTRRRREIIDGNYLCAKCGRWLPADHAHFKRDLGMALGLRSQCRECDGNRFNPALAIAAPEKPATRHCALEGCNGKLAPSNPENVCYRHPEWGVPKGRVRVHER